MVRFADENPLEKVIQFLLNPGQAIFSANPGQAIFGAMLVGDPPPPPPP